MIPPRTASMRDTGRRMQMAGRLHAEFARIEGRLDALYEDRLDGRIDAAFYDGKAAEQRAHQAALREQIARIEAARPVDAGQAVSILELAQTAASRFVRQDGPEKRRLLDFVVSNATWARGELTVEFRQPFAALAVTTATAETGEAASAPTGDRHPKWSGFLRTFRTVLQLESLQIPAGLLA